MKILKQGKDKRFKCPKCGCKFEASHNEYSIRYNIPLPYKYVYYCIISVHCPYCDFLIETPVRM